MENTSDRLGFIDYNIADILNNLIDDDPHKRNIAYWQLDNQIVIQGGLSESCFYILPFNELGNYYKQQTRTFKYHF